MALTIINRAKASFLAYFCLQQHGMKKVVIDIGNTLTKVGVFEGKEIIVSKQFRGDEQIQLLSTGNEMQTSGIISSVRDIPGNIRQLISNIPHLITLSADTPLPFVLGYNSPETLGKDRIAAVAGARAVFPECNILAIDAGTAITYDLLTAENCYLGGGISPGISTRFRALHNYTGRLPLVHQQSFDELIGQTTEESIQSGVLNGVVAEVDGIIQRYSESFENLHVVLTGGDLNYLADKLKSNIFALPNLVLMGLNEILDFNETPHKPDHIV